MSFSTPHHLRRALRVRSKGAIKIEHGATTIRARILDIAAGGVSVRADLPLGLLALSDDLLRIDLRLDVRGGAHFVLLGRAVRVDVVHRTIAIRFDAVPDGFEDCVQNELLAAVEYDALPHSLILVDSAGAQRTTIAAAFRDAGCEVVEVSSPLEAIDRLAKTRFDHGVIAIADTVPEEVADELREFLRSEHPNAHMVAIGAADIEREPLESWLSANDVEQDLQTRVERVITSRRRRRTISPASAPVSADTLARWDDDGGAARVATPR